MDKDIYVDGRQMCTAMRRAMWRKREFTMADAVGEERQTIILSELNLLNKPPPLPVYDRIGGRLFAVICGDL